MDGDGGEAENDPISGALEISVTRAHPQLLNNRKRKTQTQADKT